MSYATPISSLSRIRSSFVSSFSHSFCACFLVRHCSDGRARARRRQSGRRRRPDGEDVGLVRSARTALGPVWAPIE